MQNGNFTLGHRLLITAGVTFLVWSHLAPIIFYMTRIYQAFPIGWEPWYFLFSPGFCCTVFIKELAAPIQKIDFKLSCTDLLPPFLSQSR